MMHSPVIVETPSNGAGATDLVLDLADLNASMLPIAGGKAANLGELMHAGLPVPPGFCVTTGAYEAVAGSAAIDFDSFRSAAPDEIRHLARRTREALLATPIPASVAAAVAGAYNRLGAEMPVAVRSSATAEDLPNASFAGQQDTYLNITGASAVLDAVRRCWASLWTERAVVYRATNGIDHRLVRLAVVVQRMVEADTAGVLFTANPLSGRRREAVINANPGLGEAVVSGAVNPDHFLVDTASEQIIERRLGDKRFEVRSQAGGGTRRVAKTANASHACVSDDQVRRLAKLGDRVEAHFGSPQDIEWAIDANGTVWLTQSRPITTLFPLPLRARSHGTVPPTQNADDLRVYFCFSVAQGLYRPLTPMGLAAFRMIGSSVAPFFGVRVDEPLSGPPALAEAGQRVFLDLTNTLRGCAGRAILPRVFDVMEARSAATLRRLFDDPRLPVERRSWIPFASKLLRALLRFGVPLQILQAVVRPEAARARVGKIGTDLMARLTPLGPAGADERLDFVERTLSREIIAVGPTTLPVAAFGLAMLGVAGKLLGDAASPAELETVLRGLPHNVTSEMDLTLWNLANRIRVDEPAARVLRDEPVAVLARRFRTGGLPVALQNGLADFLSRYGHRAVAEIDIGMPRWSDDPSHILGVLANYLRLERPEQAPDAQFARGAAEAEAMIETLAGRARRRGRLRGRLVRLALNRARQLAGVREIPKYYMVAALAAVRRELSEVGADLARRGAINSADDVFYLDLSEARMAAHGLDVRDTVAARRETYQTELRRRRVPTVLLSDGTEPEARPSASGAADLSGTPASAGTVSGIARVVLDPVGARIEPGEILVAPSTDPGWTPLFLTAGGLVMEMGGANSHGAVVAREYGIPAVVGVPDATLRISTGQRIAVNGTTGAITLEPRAAAG